MKKILKYFTVFCLLLVMSFSFCGCFDNPEDEPPFNPDDYLSNNSNGGLTAEEIDWAEDGGKIFNDYNVKIGFNLYDSQLVKNGDLSTVRIKILVYNFENIDFTIDAAAFKIDLKLNNSVAKINFESRLINNKLSEDISNSQFRMLTLSFTFTRTSYTQCQYSVYFLDLGLGSYTHIG